MESVDRWWVYICRTSRKSLYTGISLDIERRMREHNGDGAKGAKALRGQRPVVLVWREGPMSQTEALALERSIKRMAKAQKEALVLTASNLL